jgi:hypothetical protein
LSGSDGNGVECDGDFGIGQYVGMVFRYGYECYVIEWSSDAIDFYFGSDGVFSCSEDCYGL